MPGELNSPYRRDPFTGDFHPKWNEADEVHVATLQESNGLVGFFLFEAPQLRQPSDFICAVLDDEYDETGTPLVENARLDAPDADEFRVDYDADGYFGTGFVEVNASRTGQFFRVGYWGLGTPPRWETHLRAALIVDENLAIAGDLEVGGNADISEDLSVAGVVQLAFDEGSVISASNKKINEVATGLTSTDAVNLAQAKALAASHGFDVFTGVSGSWTRPAGVQYLHFALIGRGGDSESGGNSGGGGGGGAVSGMINLDTFGVAEGGTIAYDTTSDAIFAGCTGGEGGDGDNSNAGAAGTFSITPAAGLIAQGQNGGIGAVPRSGGGGGGAAANPFARNANTAGGAAGVGGTYGGWLAGKGGSAGSAEQLGFGGGRDGNQSATRGAAVLIIEY